MRELEFQIQNSFKKPSTVYIFVISALEPRDRWISAACQSVSLAGNSEFLVQNLPERGRKRERERGGLVKAKGISLCDVSKRLLRTLLISKLNGGPWNLSSPPALTFQEH